MHREPALSLSKEYSNTPANAQGGHPMHAGVAFVILCTGEEVQDDTSS